MRIRSKKKMKKFTPQLPEHIVEDIITTLLPIRLLLRNRSLSRRYLEAPIRSRDLDFTKLYTTGRSRPKALGIIQNVFTQHRGDAIQRFVLRINPAGVEDQVRSWIQTCNAKKIEELTLDFSKAREEIDFEFDFSAIETLTVLRLLSCKFEIPENIPPKGLKLLKTLTLMGNTVSEDLVNTIFSNCIHLETLELIKCRFYGTLCINAGNHKKFKSLALSFKPETGGMYLDAPTLESFKYDGYVKVFNFSQVKELKETRLHFKRSFNWHYYDLSFLVLANMGSYSGVHVLSTTNIFLEALTYKFLNGRLLKPAVWFCNLKEFEICFKAPTVCNLFDIIDFLRFCPKLEKLLIDINDFTFEPDRFWDLHQKNYCLNFPECLLTSIKEVEINGYKGHSHEICMVVFFAKKAQSLNKLILRKPKKPMINLNQVDHANINYIRNLCPKKDLIEVVEA